MRLTTDVALLHDPVYLDVVKEFASNMTAFDEAFDSAWFKLTTTNGARWSPAAKCDAGGFTAASNNAGAMLSSDILVV